MKKFALTLLVALAPLFLSAQETLGFKFGQTTTYRELEAKTFPSDTSANAYVIQEYGEAYIDYDKPSELIFREHVKIKILRPEGLKYADIQIPLFKSDGGSEESIRDIYASSFNIVNGKIQETKLDFKTVFNEKNSTNYNMVKFAIPNAKVGSVIEYQYQVRSPFLWNFREWEFQADIPKVLSEYKSTIPAYYNYNVTLRGYLELANHESNILQECLLIDQAKADCAVNKYTMKNIPAFKEEEYMTARTNYLSAIRYELKEIRFPSGRIEKYTKEWKDADLELKTRSDFGVQLKRGKDVVEAPVNIATAGETDMLSKAKKVYDFVKFHYVWNEKYGSLTDLGIKKAFEEKKGNVADINLTLVAALRQAGFNCDPVLIGTRGKGRPVELHPVLSDFNYVIAKLDLDGKTYLLDAVDDYLPFGSISISCYNGIGRVINPEASFWMDIAPTEKDRTVTMIALKLSNDGQMTGTINMSYTGYAALKKRKSMAEFQDEKSYLDQQKASKHFFNITNYERVAENDLSKPLIEKFGVEFSAFDPGAAHVLFNPFIEGRTETNPFKSDQRMYPVDFAVPLEEMITIYVDFPETFEVASMPDKVGIALPKAGGRYIFGSMVNGNKLTVNNNLVLTRTVFAPEEYPYLKEVFSKMLQAQGADVIFRKKQ